MTAIISPQDFTDVIKPLRTFFYNKGFLEVHTQNRLSILAACEDPSTIGTFNYAGAVFPLPQTGQMWLEYELLKTPDLPGVFCVSTSFRQEPNPIEGRHDLIFPMFEFEMHGGMNDLIKLEAELCNHLGFEGNFHRIRYAEAARDLEVKEIGAEEEEILCSIFGDVVFLTHFPLYTSPFWNMKSDGSEANKVDILIHGIETIGSAERSVDKEEMREQFNTISNGMYAEILFSSFGKERVLHELDNFLAFDFFPRSGGGIGITRLIRGMKLHKLLK